VLRDLKQSNDAEVVLMIPARFVQLLQDMRGEYGGPSFGGHFFGGRDE
jgi:hypothetical protein